MSEWLVAAKRADFNQIASEFHISPITARLLVNRGLKTRDEITKYLSFTDKMLYDGNFMRDMGKGVLIIKEMIANQSLIRIIGDYDADGICATYILYNTLSILNAKVDYVIPNRMTDGYGLNENLILQAHETGVKCILTCDNGVSAIQQVTLAKSLGMKIVITDHHEIPFTEANGKTEYHIPEADAVIDPKQEDCLYPFPDICGAFVAYKFAQKLLAQSANAKPILSNLYIFAAIATVCDVMELKDENRILVKNGMELMSEECRNVGLKALLRQNGLEGIKITPYHLGFIIGPCINATGRLETADKAMQLFMEEDPDKADILAQELITINNRRKQMTELSKEEAESIVEANHLNDKVLVVLLPNCHESLAGIIAGRLRERYGKPAFVFTKTEKCFKGSGRSIEKYSMYEELNQCKDLLLSFGGHPMAAGVSVSTEEDLIALRIRLNDNSALKEADFAEVYHIEMELPLVYADMSLIEEFSILEPFGNGNKKPLFVCRDMKVLAVKVMGVNKNVCRFSMVDKNGNPFSMIRFASFDETWNYIKEKYPDLKDGVLSEKETDNGIVLNVVYQAEINIYNGRKSAQYVIQDIK